MGFTKGVKQGFYEPVHKDKWILTESFDTKGKKVVKYRSSWERHFCVFADNNPDIIKVNSEGVVIPYFNPIKDKISRYYIDFMIQTKSNTFIVEIKPFAETKPPKPPRKKTDKSIKNYMKSLQTYQVNIAKWSAAEDFAKEKNIKFIIITEKELFNNH